MVFNYDPLVFVAHFHQHPLPPSPTWPTWPTTNQGQAVKGLQATTRQLVPVVPSHQQPRFPTFHLGDRAVPGAFERSRCTTSCCQSVLVGVFGRPATHDVCVRLIGKPARLEPEAW